MVPMINQVPTPESMEVLYEGTDVLKPGYALGFDHNRLALTGESGDVFYVEKPSTANLVLYSAGVCAQHAHGSGDVISLVIIPWWWQGHNFEVFTDKNCAAGDELGILNGTYFWNTYSSGRMRFVCTQTVDRSSTNGLVRGILINQA